MPTKLYSYNLKRGENLENMVYQMVNAPVLIYVARNGYTADILRMVICFRVS
jgi:hypothetical protein